MHSSIEEKLPALRDICRGHRVARLALFGSAVGGRFDPSRSDLDFVVEYLPAQAPMTLRAYFDLKDALEKLFGRSVDLVERAAVRNPYFQEELEETQVQVYAA
jgi:uncharacterized protein